MLTFLRNAILEFSIIVFIISLNGLSPWLVKVYCFDTDNAQITLLLGMLSPLVLTASELCLNFRVGASLQVTIQKEIISQLLQLVLLLGWNHGWLKFQEFGK